MALLGVVLGNLGFGVLGIGCWAFRLSEVWACRVSDRSSE